MLCELLSQAVSIWQTHCLKSVRVHCLSYNHFLNFFHGQSYFVLIDIKYLEQHLALIKYQQVLAAVSTTISTIICQSRENEYRNQKYLIYMQPLIHIYTQHLLISPTYFFRETPITEACEYSILFCSIFYLPILLAQQIMKSVRE